MTDDRPQTGAYRPLVAVRRPGGKPDAKPRHRVLMSKSLRSDWDHMLSHVSEDRAQRLWDHLAFSADRKPEIGRCSKLKGRQFRGKDGWSEVYHYEVSGPGRVDYRFHGAYTGGEHGDPHPIVEVLRVDMSSH